MICYGYRTFKDYMVVYHCYYSKVLNKFHSWFVLPLLGEYEPFEELDKLFSEMEKHYKF